VTHFQGGIEQLSEQEADHQVPLANGRTSRPPPPLPERESVSQVANPLHREMQIPYQPPTVSGTARYLDLVLQSPGVNPALAGKAEYLVAYT